MKWIVGIVSLTLLVAVFGVVLSTRNQASAAAPLVIQVGPPDRPARLTAPQVVEILKYQGTILFPYPAHITVQYGTYTLRLDTAAGPGDYWAVTLDGLYKDSHGNDLLLAPGPNRFVHRESR